MSITVFAGRAVPRGGGVKAAAIGDLLLLLRLRFCFFSNAFRAPPQWTPIVIVVVTTTGPLPGP